jgi:sugar diacid utilization regulator
VAAVVRYDGQYDTELSPTLEQVLAAEGDVAAVAADLGLPAHRVRFRLEKARELSGLDAGVVAHRRALEVGLRCFRVVAPGLPG